MLCKKYLIYLQYIQILAIMKKILYLFTTLLFISCNKPGDSVNYEDVIKESLTKGKGEMKILEMSDAGKITVADSVQFLTDQFKNSLQNVLDRMQLAKETTQKLLEKEKKQSEIDKYNDNLTRIEHRIDSINNLMPDNLKGYENLSPDEVLVVIKRVKFSAEYNGTTIQDTYDFYIAPDASVVYDRKKSK